MPLSGQRDKARDTAVADRHEHPVTIAAIPVQGTGDPAAHGAGNGIGIPPCRDALGQARSQRDDGITVFISVRPDHDRGLLTTHDRQSGTEPLMKKQSSTHK
ncbi:hypothetical protein GCM10012289_73100 [Nonomuraea cavernae]|uniref:Uncharacterized protein n=1 Tax=Nonomuraea cavernae TaxID=2045107 RepID=A0A917ZI60_9ACTN|nr:hypothetical protein GCM10012289_73100 [Nonomuraea cavernae]